MKKSACFLCLVFLCYFSIFANESQAQKTFHHTTVFEKNMEGYATFRIPAIIRTNSGTLLAFAEGRRFSNSDSGDIDLVMRRSTDHGKTWGPIIVVWDDKNNTCGNPTPVVDKKSGRILLLMTWNRGDDSERRIMQRVSKDSRRIFICQSEDDGKNWSTPQEITPSVKLADWTWYATGPCHAIQLQKKPYKGRFVIPCNHAQFVEGQSEYHAHLLFSDDGGGSWNIGGIMKGGNESTVVELADGSIMHNARWQTGVGRFARHIAISKNGGEDLGTVRRDAQLPEPICQGSIIGYSKRKQATNDLLFSNPASIRHREKLTLRRSKDGGKTWNEGLLICEGPAAYSDLVILRHQDVGVLYETGQRKPYEKIVFAVIPKRYLK